MVRHMGNIRVGTAQGDARTARAAGVSMSDRRRDVALAIKHCLDSLASDAQESSLPELAHFIGIASLAAEDAARTAAGAEAMLDDLLRQEPAGRC